MTIGQECDHGDQSDSEFKGQPNTA